MICLEQSSWRPAILSRPAHAAGRRVLRPFPVALLVFALQWAASTAPTLAQSPPCQPCAGLHTNDPAAVAQLLREGPPIRRSSDEEPAPGSLVPLFVKWTATLADPASASASRQIVAQKATPWIEVSLASPPPLATSEELQEELRQLAALAREADPASYFQLRWLAAEEGAVSPQELAYFIKRATVVVTGAQPDSPVFIGPLSTDRQYLEALYAEDVAAYVDGVVLAAPSADELQQARQALRELDPAARIAITDIPLGDDPTAVLSGAARQSAAGASLTLFDALGSPNQEMLAPFRLLARELAGDLSLDTTSKPGGVAEAWSFVRGEDLSLRVIVSRDDEGPVSLSFPDPSLRSPKLYDLATGEPNPLFSGRRTATGFDVTVEEAPAHFLLAFERMSRAELEGLEGVEERVDVEDSRLIPVEEILRQLQAFEDTQARRLSTYVATNTTSLRFQFGTGVQSVDTTFKGDFFFRQGKGFDWAWQDFYVNGVRWRGKRIPEIPLIQPEKAASLPLEIHFTKDYRYRLRGTGNVDGREAWVVDFEPAVTPEPGASFFQGTVWVDKVLWARLKTRAVQLGLEGEVLSNEETITYQPIDANGREVEASKDAYWLPVRLVGQQLFSILNATTVVEREVLLSGITINPADFDSRLESVLASSTTMVRDTEAGLRYLVPDKETGERKVVELDSSRTFIVGGVFYDESLDFPLPLAGINWLSFDLKDTGTQANVFFAGALLNATLSTPSLFGSRFDAGVDAFALAVAGTDSIFRGEREAIEEDVESMRPNIDLSLGHPIGSFGKLDFQYSLAYNKFSRADDTAPEFVLPEDHLSHHFSLTGRYNRSGYRFRLGGSYNIRDEWARWGLPGNTEFDPAQKEYTLYGAAFGKTWHLPRFQKIGAEIEYVDGEDLDRFSKYEFGYFSDLRVHGYQSDRVRAEQAWAAHLSYGFEVGELFRLDLVGDAAWATDEASLLKDELLAGVGLAGTLLGPWRTVINIDLGVAVAGPDDGFSLFLAFLKLFG